MANSIAEKKPEVLKPSISLSTNKTINTVMMKENSPKVRIVTGKVRMRRMVPIVAFTRAIRIPAIIALKKPSTVTPGIRKAATDTVTPIKRISSINLIVKRLKYLAFCLSAMTAACNNKSEHEKATASIQFQLNADSSQIVLKGLDHVVLQAVQEDSLAQNVLKSMFAVYKQASDEQLVGLEKPLPGKYEMVRDEISYMPDSGFSKGTTYRAEFRMPEFYDRKDVVNGGNLPGKVQVKEKLFEF